MHRAILISSHYPATSGYPNHACWAEASEQLESRLSEQGYLVESLSSGDGLVERLRSALRHEDKQASLLLHFSGYLLLTESGDPALLLSDENVTALRLSQLLERSARRFGRVLLIVDAVRGSSTRTIARASREAQRVPEDALARMAVECAKQVDNVTMLVGVRPWADDEADEGRLSEQLNRALRQLAAVAQWHTSHDLEEWLDGHADSASFVLRSHHCDPAFPLFPRRPYPSSPHAPPLPPTLGPGEPNRTGATSLDELAALIRDPSTAAPEPPGRARAKVQTLPIVAPPPPAAVAPPPPAAVAPPPPAAVAPPPPAAVAPPPPAAVAPPPPAAVAPPPPAAVAPPPPAAVAPPPPAAVAPPPPAAVAPPPPAAVAPPPPAAVAPLPPSLPLDLPEPPVILPPAYVSRDEPSPAHERSAPPEQLANGAVPATVSAPPPLPLQVHVRQAGAPPPLPAERAPLAAPSIAGDTVVSAPDPIPLSPPLPIVVTGPVLAGDQSSTLVSAGNIAPIAPQRTVALSETARAHAARPNPPLPPPQLAPPPGFVSSSVASSGAAGTSMPPALGSVPPPGGLRAPGGTQVSAGRPTPPTAPPTNAKTTPVVVVAPPSVPPPSAMPNTVDAPAPSFPALRPPSLPPQVTSPESWPPNVHATSLPSRDEAALLANAQRALAMGESEEALRLAEECLVYFPHSVPAMQLAATELARLGRWARLADLYERVIGQLQDPAGAAQLCSALARICSAQLNDQNRAQQAVLLGLSRQPEHPSLLAELASQEERRGHWKLAAEYSRRALRSAPLDARLCREALRRFQQTGQLDLAWNAACVLGYLGQASEQERALVNARRSGNLPQLQRALNGADYQLGLAPLQPSTPLHQVLSKLYGPLRQCQLLKPKQQQQLLGTIQQEDVRQSTTTLARTFAWSCQLLDVAPPALYLTAGDALPTVLNVDQPAWCVGRTIGRGLSLPELVFLWARALIRTRPENRIATCITSTADLRDAVEAAALLAGVATRASGNAKKLSKAMKRHADRSLWNELRGPLQAVVDDSLYEALIRWREELERAANRLGLLACGDPELAARTLARYADESVLDRQTQLNDLLGFTMSSEYEALTARLLRA